MMNQKIQELLNTYPSLHIECTADTFELLDTIIKQQDNYTIFDENDGLYIDMKVKGYLKFFAELVGHKHLLKESIDRMHLSDLLNKRIEKCSLQEKKRILFAKEIIKDCDFYYFKEPLSHLDEDSIKMVLHWFEELRNKDKKVVTTSRSLKEVCLCDGYHIRIYDNRMKVIDEGDMSFHHDEDNVLIQKISVKYNGRIFLFNPEEIDYIEAGDGKSQVIVRNEMYISSSSMDELEDKLHRFGFYRSHRSYLVNMQKVTQIVKWTRNSYSLKLMNYETTVPLSKNKIQDMKEMYQF